MSDEESSGPPTLEPASAVRSTEELFAVLYGELRRLAEREMGRSPGVTVSPTTLVHEAYLNLAARDHLSFGDRGRFLGYAARAIRGLLIDFARRKRALKRGAGFHITELRTQAAEEIADASELTRLSEALDALAERDARLAELVDLKYFCGFSVAEIAALRGASERTVHRDWEKARLILFQQLRTED